MYKIIFVIASILCFIFAYLIWNKKNVTLLHLYGYEEETNVDKNKLGKYMGIYLIAAGIWILSFILINPKYRLVSTVIFICISIIYTIFIELNKHK